MTTDQLRSPAIEHLQQALDRSDSNAVADFWEMVAARGTPLIEALPEDDQNLLVTFLWRGHEQTEDVLVLGGWHGYHDQHNRLVRLGTTDVWYHSYRMRPDTRATYHLLPNDRFSNASWWSRLRAAQPDPLNPHTLLLPPDEADPDDHEIVLSIFTLPEAPDDAWTAEHADAAVGERQVLQFTSQILNNQRRICVYTPPGYSSAGEPYGLLLLFDGFFFHHGLQINTVLDQLIVSGRIPPLVMALIDHPDGATRYVELHGSMPFTDFLAQELVPWLRRSYHLRADAAHTTIAGASHGGLASAFTALTYPAIFGNVISLSGSFEWRPDGEEEYEWLARQIAARARLDLRWSLSVGQLETWLGPHDGPNRVLANRHFRTVLQAKGYLLHYHEAWTGHDYLYWRDSLARALVTLLGAHSDPAM